jgi:zinc-ribbon domain
LFLLVTCHSSLVTVLMEPEISRRCRACGAAVRSRAGFCPQCGAPVNPEEAVAATAPAVEMQETLPGPTEELMATAPPSMTATMASDGALTSGDVEEAAEQPLAASPAPVLTEERQAPEAAAVAGDSAAETAGEVGEPAQPPRRHRVKVAALDAVEGKIGPRVEKLRHASTVVLDEAADDPGLRFVLVAAVLILLSLGVLLLSQILD